MRGLTASVPVIDVTGPEPVVQPYPSGATTWTAVAINWSDLEPGATMTVQAHVICTS